MVIPHLQAKNLKQEKLNTPEAITKLENSF